jgi:hypothetical protein
MVPTEEGAAVTAKESCWPGSSVMGRTTELGEKIELLDAMEVIVTAVVPWTVKTSGSELWSPVLTLPKANGVGVVTKVLFNATPVPLRDT